MRQTRPYLIVFVICAIFACLGGPASRWICAQDGPWLVTPPQIGACCVEGQCLHSDEPACDSIDGEWLADQVCAPTTCAPPASVIGACCVGSACSQVEQAVCGAVGGAWKGGDCTAALCVPPVPADCWDATATWRTTGLGAAQAAPFVFQADVIPGGAPIDGVVALSLGPAVRYADFACLVRFGPDRQIDVNDGGTYRAAVPIVYAAGTTYAVRMTVDPARQKYSVSVNGTVLATDFAFRKPATSLDRWGLIADPGPMRVCRPTVTVVPPVDTDGDGTPDAQDGCPADAAKVAPGACGCGEPEIAGCGDVPPPLTGAVLIPGSGFTGNTPQPAGTGPRAIARWDVVPFQIVNGQLRVGVVSFHINGIDRVEFSCDGGAWISDSTMELNTDSGVWEYFVTFDASKFATDKLSEIRAIAYPKSPGTPRVLQGDVNTSATSNSGEWSLKLWANPNGTAASQVTVLADGTHSLGTVTGPTDRWRIYRGTSKTGTRLSGMTFNGLVKFENLTITGSSSIAADTHDGTWFSNVNFAGSGSLATFSAVAGGGVSGTAATRKLWFTGCEFGYWGEPTSLCYAQLMRDVYIHHNDDDVYQTVGLIVNNRVFNFGWDSPPESHADLFDTSTSHRWGNQIAFGLDVDHYSGQGIYVSPWLSDGYERDCAYVNVKLTRRAPNIFNTSQLTSSGQGHSAPHEHFLFWHCTIDDQIFTRNWPATNMSIVGCVFERFSAAPTDLSWTHHNHFRTASEARGGFPTTGDPKFVNRTSPGGDWRPASGSPLIAKVPRVVPVDLAGKPRPATCAAGALEP